MFKLSTSIKFCKGFESGALSIIKLRHSSVQDTGVFVHFTFDKVIAKPAIYFIFNRIILLFLKTIAVLSGIIRGMMRYFICNEETDEIIFELHDLIERFDIYGDGAKAVLICDYPLEADLLKLKPLRRYIIRFLYKARTIEIDIYLEAFQKLGNKLILNCVMNDFGTISILQTVLSSSEERPWINMLGEHKRLYNAACLHYSGIANTLPSSPIIMQGKYITDYYSFFCEIGHALYGRLGYMGRCFYGFKDCFCEIKEHSHPTLTWMDFESAKYSMENNNPFGKDRFSSVNEIIDELADRFDLYLE